MSIESAFSICLLSATLMPWVILRLQVGNRMFATVLAGVRHLETSTLALMQDPVRVRQHEADKDALQKLEKAFAELKKI